MSQIDHAARLEDLRWMIDTGTDLDDAARRLDITVDGLEVWCRRWGHIAELDALRARRELSPAGMHAQMAGRATAKSRRYREAS